MIVVKKKTNRITGTKTDYCGQSEFHFLRVIEESEKKNQLVISYEPTNSWTKKTNRKAYTSRQLVGRIVEKNQ